MPSYNCRIENFVLLGEFIGQHTHTSDNPQLEKINSFFLESYREAIKEAELFNPWFTRDNLLFALEQWSQALTIAKLEKWLSTYPQSDLEPEKPQTLAIVMAGNIPLVGFHDFISGLAGGHKVLVKPSSDDAQILPVLAQVLVAINRDWAPFIRFAESKMSDFDAVIATGSNNSARYFDHYFSKYPHIIRKNRSSVAVLDGTESNEELKQIGEDIFRYFGLGCRNISKVYIPQNFEIQKIFEAIYDFKDVIDHNKYSNNYDYHRAIFLMEHHEFLDNGFFMIKESEVLHAPVGVLHYQRYSDKNQLIEELESNKDKLQVIASQAQWVPNKVALGQSQKPELWDYADGVDTIDFLRSLSKA